MPATITHALSMTSPNDTRYENQVSNWNQTHALTLNAVGSEISGGFGNAGGVTFGYDGTNVTAAAPAGAPSPINFSAGTTSSNIGSVVFSDSNGVAWGLNGSTITASYSQSTHSHSSLFFADSNGLNWGTNASSVTGSYTQSTHSHSSLSFSNLNGVTFGLNASTLTASVAAVTNSSWTVSDTATSATVGRLAFTAANGITMSLSTSNNGNHTVFASYTVPIVTNSAWTVSDAATSGTVARLAFSNLNGLTLSLLTGAGGSHTIVGSYTQSTHSHRTEFQALTLGGNTAGTTTFAASNTDTIFLNGGNNITLSGNGGTITIIGPTPAAGVAAGVSNTGNTAGNTGTVSSGTLVFAASGGITASQSTAAGQSTIWYSVAAPIAQTNQTVGLYALGNTTQNSSTTLDARTMSFNGLGAATWGYSNGSIQVSVPATSSLVGTSGLSVSTAGSTISVLPVALSAWDPYPLLSGTAVSSHAPASFWFSRMILDWPVAVSYANVLKSLNVSAPGMSSQNSSATNKFSYSHGLTLFTRQDFAANSSRMSQWTTASFGMTGSLSQSSSSASVALSWVTNSTGGTTSFSTTSSNNSWTNFFTGMQMFRIPLVTTLTPGEYFIGQAHSSTTATVGSNFTLLSVSNLHVAPQSNTFATITSSGSLAFSSPDGLGIGIASAVTTNATMAMSVISATTQNWWYMNFSNT